MKKMCIYIFIQHIKTKFALLIFLAQTYCGENFSGLQALLLLKMKYLLNQKHSLSGANCKVVVELGRGRQNNEKKDYGQFEGENHSILGYCSFLYL